MSSNFFSSPAPAGARPPGWAAAGPPPHLQLKQDPFGQIRVGRANEAGAQTIARERADAPGVAALVHELDAFRAALHPAAGKPRRFDLDALMAPNFRLLVVRGARQQVLGCGAALLQEDYAELKHMMVLPEQRGRGIGARLVLALEREAVRAGRPLLRLEIGVSQIDAQRLCERMGFERCGPFGAYRADPFSIFMEKLLG